MSDAEAEIVVVPDNVDPLIGEVIDIVGFVVSETTLLIFTLVPEDVCVLPAASLAVAVKVCAPLLTVFVFHEVEYGDVVSVPINVPST